MKKLVECCNGVCCWYLNNEQSIVYLIKIGDNDYIGSTERAKRRLTSHINSLLCGKHHNLNLQKAFNETNSFSIFLLEECDSKENAFIKEKMYIRGMLPNLNSNLYFKEWLLPLSNKKELVIVLSKIFRNTINKVGVGLKKLEKNLGLKKKWLKKMGNGIIDITPQQLILLLYVLRLSVIVKDNKYYIRYIKDKE